MITGRPVIVPDRPVDGLPVPPTPEGDRQAPQTTNEALTMTTRGTTPHPGALVDAPALHLDQLSGRQRAGRSCCWCSGTPDPRFPIRLGTDNADLHACEPCAGMYGVPAVEADA